MMMTPLLGMRTMAMQTLLGLLPILLHRLMEQHSVFAADMDGDGDMDILSASLLDDTIAWYENDGNANPTFTAADIATSADGAILFLRQIWMGTVIWIFFLLLIR